MSVLRWIFRPKFNLFDLIIVGSLDGYLEIQSPGHVYEWLIQDWRWAAVSLIVFVAMLLSTAGERLFVDG